MCASMQLSKRPLEVMGALEERRVAIAPRESLQMWVYTRYKRRLHVYSYCSLQEIRRDGWIRRNEGHETVKP